MAKAAKREGWGGAGKAELTAQVIFQAVQDNHVAAQTPEQQRDIFLEIKVKTTQREVEILLQKKKEEKKHSQLPETYWSRAPFPVLPTKSFLW